MQPPPPPAAATKPCAALHTHGAAPEEVAPGGHAAQEAEPAATLYELTPHGEHAAAPAAVEYCPAAQGVQTAPLCAAPAGHEQVSEAPEPPATKFAGHAQVALPGMAEAYMLVDVQGAQLAEFGEAENVLAGQSVHWPPAAALRKEPGPHTAPKVGVSAMPLSTGCAGDCCSQNMLTTPPKLSKLFWKE